MGDENKAFEHYTVKHRIVAWISQNVFDGVQYRVRRGLLKGMKRKGGLAFLPDSVVREVETAETRFWRSQVFTDLVVYDIGAFQGLLALFFARQARQVICYEPNDGNRNRLLENVRLNGLRNVVVRPVGIGTEEKHLLMKWDTLMPGGASVEEAISSQLPLGRRLRTEEITITTLDHDIEANNLPKPDFIKIDIEGFELEALKGARRTLAVHAPALFLEMHGATMAEKKRRVSEIVRFLTDNGYSDIRHIETQSTITPDNSSLGCEGHLYCSKR
jgi:FkbM family methyltransferase